MIYVKIKAGLGHQMFQYAFGRALSLRRKELLVLDTSWYGHQKDRETIRTYDLDKYKIVARVATPDEIAPFNTKFQLFQRKILYYFGRLIGKSEYVYYPKLARSNAKYFEGHWVTEKYFLEFADTIRNELSLSKPLGSSAHQFEQKILNDKSTGKIPVSLHVRRGDVITNPYAVKFQGALETVFYKDACEYLFARFPKEYLKFYVFSDGVEWARSNIVTGGETEFVSNPQISDHEEIYLMSICSHHIVANSSFSWWGAWLNPNKDKIVIAPKKWLADSSFKTTDAVPPEWIRM